MKVVPEFPDGYYWARHDADGGTLVVRLEHGRWLACGVSEALNEEFEPGRQIIKRIAEPVH
jgi:hypothetical protein